VRSAVLCIALLALLACSSTYSEGAPLVPDAAVAETGTSDAGSGGDADAEAAAPTCVGTACERLVFVSSETSNGKFGGEGGLVGADALCQRLADASAKTRGRPFRAWLSTASSPAIGRLTKGTKPYRRVDGMRVHDELAQFTQGSSLKAPINVDENGITVATSEVWTGTEADGTADLATCNGWTATTQAATGHQGTAGATDEEWSSAATTGCNAMARVYCFEN
jgi:hypothetical protein